MQYILGLLLGFLFEAYGCVFLFGCQHHTGVTVSKDHNHYSFFCKNWGLLHIGVPSLNTRWREITGVLGGSHRNTAGQCMRMSFRSELETFRDADPRPESQVVVGFSPLVGF